MIRPLLLAAALLLAADPAKETMQKELEQLQGVWVFFESGSTPNSAKGGYALVIVGERIIARRTSLDKGQQLQVTEEDFARFTIDPSQTPKAIDLEMLSGPIKGKRVQAAYLLQDETLELLLPKKPDAPRPTSRKDASVMRFLRPAKLAKMFKLSELPRRPSR